MMLMLLPYRLIVLLPPMRLTENGVLKESTVSAVAGAATAADRGDDCDQRNESA